jgi:hypothetical protein
MERTARGAPANMKNTIATRCVVRDFEPMERTARGAPANMKNTIATRCVVRDFDQGDDQSCR